ncbi:MAG: hypothetical protein QM730_26560 [Anaerolineales bacterium]
MNTKHLLIASLIGAVITTTFSNAPILNLLNCLVCFPFWSGPLFAAWYYMRRAGRITMEDAITVGAVTGLFAGFLGFLWVAGGLGLVSQVKQYLPAGVMPVELWMGSTSALFTLTSVVIHAIFGAAGGALAGAIFNKRALAN